MSSLSPHCMQTRTVQQILQDAKRRLAAAEFQPSLREANLLLARALGWSEVRTLARTEHRPSAEQQALFEQALDRRLTGEPVAYILGEKEFYGRPFHVDRRVLIPRPESEHLIEAALGLRLPERPLILDIGTGSGCLALTLALELAGSRLVATDRSASALAVARDNRRRYALERRVALAACDLASAVDLGSFDLVISNPPYVGEREAASLSAEIREFEPQEALFAGAAGVALHRRILAELEPLRSGTWLVMEIGAGQEETLRSSSAPSAFRCAEVRPDYAGRSRVVLLERR